MAVPALQVIVTKLASGNVLMQFLSPNGTVRFTAVMLTAHMTTTNTNVNGGATGASFTMNYAQDQTAGDYPAGFCTAT